MNDRTISRSREHTILPAAIGAWCAYVIFDFLINAVLLAPYWRATASYWLPPLELFRMLPLAYTLFAIYCGAATWLLRRLFGDQLKLSKGLRFGVIAGLLVGMSSALGSYCVFRMPGSALIIWPVSITFEFAGAVAVATWVLLAEHPWRRVGMVFGMAVLLFVLGVAVQNLISSKISWSPALEHTGLLVTDC